MLSEPTKVRADSIDTLEKTISDNGYYNTLLSVALSMTAEALEGKVDFMGEPILSHVLRVSGRMHDRTEKLVAILHDTLEDSDLFTELDIKSNFPPEIADAVICLTRRDDENYIEEYIKQRVLSNRIATRVKYYDLMDNMDPRRIPMHLDDWHKTYKRYWTAIRLVSASLSGNLPQGGLG